MEVVHSGFDGLKFTIQTCIPTSFREALIEAKAKAIKANSGVALEFGGIELTVRQTGGRAFSVCTGEYGAEWLFLDPNNRSGNSPGITVDFRAFLLATGGLRAAKKHFDTCLAAFGISFFNLDLKVTRVDFAVDILAPSFEPNRNNLIVPPGTRVWERADGNVSETGSVGIRVSSLRAGSPNNRQLAIYDKRAEVIQTGKLGWSEIWDHSRETKGRARLDLTDRDRSQVWRFELRIGNKQLRNKWAIHGWEDLHSQVGDAFKDFCESISYRATSKDKNRSRWPQHEVWKMVTCVIEDDLREMRSGAAPDAVKTANRDEYIKMLDGQLLGLFVARAAACRVNPSDFDTFILERTGDLTYLSSMHPLPIEQRLARAAGRYNFK